MPVVAAVCVPHPPVLLPEVGKGQEKHIEKTSRAFARAMSFVADSAPHTLVVLSPHADLYQDGFHISHGEKAQGDFGSFGAPQASLEIQYDQDLVKAIQACAQELGMQIGQQARDSADLDHGTLVPLYMLQPLYPEYKVVRVGLSGCSREDHYRLGQCIAKACGDKRVAIIASGDLSHKLKEDGPYGYAPEGPILDHDITHALEYGRFHKLFEIDDQVAEKGAECGLRSFVIMAGALDGVDVESQLLSYEGPFGVGYAVATYKPGKANKSRHYLETAESRRLLKRVKQQNLEDKWVSLARYALETWLITGRVAPIPGGLPVEMTQERAGVFVSLHKDGHLRGCIGTLEPTTDNIALEIIQNALSAALEDPRFEPVEKEEMDYLNIHVDILSPPEDIDSLDQLDPQKYGVIVSRGNRRGLLLPDLEGVETGQQQVEIALQKAGIQPDEEFVLQRFTVQRHF